MYNRLSEIPVYENRQSEVSAIHYNHVQIALKRIGEEIRLQIPKLKHLDLILQKDAWIIVDRVLNDVPVAAWVDFETVQRNNLHKPIKCKQQLYHSHAHMILQHTIEAMELLLGEQLLNIDLNQLPPVANIKKEE